VGLVIVALSVNLQRIISEQQLPSRGSAAIGALVLILVGSMAALIYQPMATLAIEILVFAVFAWLLQVLSARQTIVACLESRRPLFESMIGITIGQIQGFHLLSGESCCLKGASRWRVLDRRRSHCLLRLFHSQCMGTLGRDTALIGTFSTRIFRSKL